MVSQAHGQGRQAAAALAAQELGRVSGPLAGAWERGVRAGGELGRPPEHVRRVSRPLVVSGTSKLRFFLANFLYTYRYMFFLIHSHDLNCMCISILS